MAHRNPAVLIAALVSAASAFAQPAASPPRVTEELICERPEKGAWQGWWTDTQVSRDLRKVAWLSRGSVVVNGETLGPPADEFIEPALSPDGLCVLSAGRQEKSWFVWLDAQQVGGPFDEVRRAHFSPDGRVIFAAKRGKTWTWFVDGKEQPVTTPEIGLCNGEYLVVSAAGGVRIPTIPGALERCWAAFIAVARDRVAYPTKRVDGWHMVIDGQIGPPFEKIVQITFSPDGSRLAYLGVRKDRIVAVVDGKEEPDRNAVEGLRFSADSKRVAYLAVDTSKDVTGQVVADGAPSRAYPALIRNVDGNRRANLGALYLGFWKSPELLPYLTGASDPLFRADGKVVYAARTTGSRHTLLDGAGLETAPGIDEAGKEGIWVEGTDQPLFPASLVLSGPVQSEVGDHVGWVEWEVKGGRWVGFVDGQPRATVLSAPKPRSNSAEHVTLSRDGSRLAFVAVAGGSGFLSGRVTYALRRVVATGLEDKPYDAADLTNLRFSDDGKHLAYEVHGAKGLEVLGPGYAGLVVLDGVPGRVYAEVLPGSMRFVGPDAVRYVARVQETKGGPYRYYRVTQAVP
jgi:hypothetical protein